MIPEELTSEYFRLERWPSKEAKKISLPLPNNLVARAAKIMAISAYPKDRDLDTGGPAHKFSEAMLAWMFRGAKALGKIERLPSWVSELKMQQVNSRFNRGCKRLHYRLMSYLTFKEALATTSENHNVQSGMIPGFTIRSSEDFGQWTVTFQPHTEEMLPEFWESARRNPRRIDKMRTQAIFPSSIPGALSSSLKAAILRHRKAFKAGSGDADLEYQNIYNRQMRLLFPVMHIMSVLHEEFVRVKRDRPNVNLVEALLRAPEWAGAAPSKILQRAPISVFQMRFLKIPICECRLINFGETANC